MPLQLVDNIATIGLVSTNDVDPMKLPMGAWSDGLNVRFDGHVAAKVAGSRTIQGSLSGFAYSLFPHTTFDGAKFFAYAGLTTVFTVNNNTHYNITRVSNTSTAVPYSADSSELWTGGVFGGLLFLNNGIDLPQIQLTPTASCKLSNLPNWPTTITTRCAALRAYKNFLVALDVTKGAQRFRQMVKWSDAADPLTPPSTWDEADTTALAGEFSLSDTDGTVIDSMPLRDVNMIYKDDSIWGMQFTGDVFVHRFYSIFTNVGLLCRNAVCAFEQFHCFVGNDLDIYVHDGNSIRSIGQDRWRDWLRQNIDGDDFKRLFVVPNPPVSEIWIFVPTGAVEYCDKVLMWNWRTDTWGLRQAENISHGAAGGIESSDYIELWSTITTDWDTETSTWAELESLPPERRLVLASPTITDGLIETEIGSTEMGATIPFMLERTGIWATPTKITEGGRTIDLQSVKFVKRVRFRTTDLSPQHNIEFKVAVRNDINSPTMYATTTKLTNGTAEVTVYKRGRFLDIRVESMDDAQFALHNFEILVDQGGEYM